MENSEKTREYHSRYLDLSDEAESLRTIDEVEDLIQNDESSPPNINNLETIVANNERLGSQGHQTPLQIDVRNLGDLNYIIRRQIETREAEKLQETADSPAQFSEAPNVSSRASSSLIIKGSEITTLKIIVDLIPTFDGNNISVQAFSRECRFAEKGVPPNLQPLLIRFLKAKVKGEAELYIKNLQFDTVDELLNTIETWTIV